MEKIFTAHLAIFVPIIIIYPPPDAFTVASFRWRRERPESDFDMNGKNIRKKLIELIIRGISQSTSNDSDEFQVLIWRANFNDNNIHRSDSNWRHLLSV